MLKPIIEQDINAKNLLFFFFEKATIIKITLATIKTKFRINGINASAKCIKGIIEKMYDIKTTPKIDKDIILCSNEKGL